MLKDACRTLVYIVLLAVGSALVDTPRLSAGRIFMLLFLINGVSFTDI